LLAIQQLVARHEAKDDAPLSWVPQFPYCALDRPADKESQLTPNWNSLLATSIELS
jgi:hypothetical protein